MHRVDLQELAEHATEVFERWGDGPVEVVDRGVVVAVFGAGFTAGFQSLLPAIDWAELEHADESGLRSLRWFE